MPTILHLPIKKKWFDMIASGEKKEEYREVKKYWIERLTWHEYHSYGEINLIHALSNPGTFRKDFDAIEFRNGYGKDAPVVRVEFLGIHYGSPANPQWIDGTNEHNWYFCIRLGKLLYSKI